MINWHSLLKKFFFIAGISSVGSIGILVAAEDVERQAILSKKELNEFPRHYAACFSAACSAFEEVGLGALPTELLSSRSSICFEEAAECLKLKSTDLQANDSVATRLELARLACSTGNFLLAEIHLRQATKAAPNSQSVCRWRALLAAARYLSNDRETDLDTMQKELRICCDSHLVDHVVNAVGSRRKTTKTPDARTQSAF